jgi:hypothetical protein
VQPATFPNPSLHGCVVKRFPRLQPLAFQFPLVQDTPKACSFEQTMRRMFGGS